MGHGGVLTVLRRLSMKTIHIEGSGGEVVMEDSRTELRRHLQIWLKGSGRILISGLGLGCVVRGLLINPAVTHIDVVEIDPIIIALIGPEFRQDKRVHVHPADALTIQWPADARWDYAWHDCWVNEDGSPEKMLWHLHADLFSRYLDRCR